MHLTSEAIRALLTTRDAEQSSDHLFDCPTCSVVADEIALDLGLDDPLAWALAELPDLPLDEPAAALAAYATDTVASGLTAAELVRDARFETQEGLLALLHASHHLLDIDPLKLRNIADAVLGAAGLAASPCDAVTAVALRERANALRRLGELPESLASIARGRAVARRLVVSEHELAIFDYIEATVLADQSCPHAARRLTQQALAVFARYGDTRRALCARLLLGALDYQMGAFDAARAVFRSLAAPFADAGDPAASVGTLHNAGDCSLQLKELETARRELVAAERGYREHGRTTEVLRGPWLRARVAMEEHAYDDAERALDAVATAFDATGLTLDAALARLDLVDLFQRTDRREDASALARALAAVFAAAGAQGRLADALAILREAVQRGWTLDEYLREAREAVSEEISVSYRTWCAQG
ncbi:MAG: hypothetical protein ACSLFQ_21085 [Thermoanaerobaculia bacterium]